VISNERIGKGMDDKTLIELIKRISLEVNSLKEKEGETATQAIMRVSLGMDEIKRRQGSHSKQQQDNMSEIKSDLSQIWSKLDSIQRDNHIQTEKARERVHKLEVSVAKDAGKVNTKLSTISTKVAMLIAAISTTVTIVGSIVTKLFAFFIGRAT
jgi:hypothetical protein